MRKLATRAGAGGAILACLLPATSAAPEFASSVSGLAGHWEHVGWVTGPPYPGKAVDIVRLNIIDFPAGTLSGEWEEVACVTGHGYYNIAASSIFQVAGDKATASSEIAGEGSTTHFTIGLTATENLSGTQALSGGIGKLPFGLDHAYGFRPFRSGGYVTPEMFLLDGQTGAYTFFPASDFPAIGVCGRI